PLCVLCVLCGAFSSLLFSSLLFASLLFASLCGAPRPPRCASVTPALPFARGIEALPKRLARALAAIRRGLRSCARRGPLAQSRAPKARASPPRREGRRGRTHR